MGAIVCVFVCACIRIRVRIVLCVPVSACIRAYMFYVCTHMCVCMYQCAFVSARSACAYSGVCALNEGIFFVYMHVYMCT